MSEPQNELIADLQNAATTCAVFNSRRVMRSLNQHYDAVMRESGLRVTQFNLLGAICLKGPIEVSLMAEKLGMDRTTLTRNLRPLEREGWVTVAAGTDRRTRVLAITPEGNIVLGKAMPLWQKAQAQVVAGLGQERFNRLLTDLAELEHVVNSVS